MFVIMFEVGSNHQISPQFMFWSEDQCHILHLATLEILERDGVMVYEEEALKLLKKAGCTVKDNLVKFPPDIVDWAIQHAPERCVLASADGERTIFLEDNMVSYGMGNDLPWFFDSRTDNIRTSKLSDVEDAAKVADVLENIDFVASLALASDVTSELVDLYHFKAMRTYTKKPILCSSLDTHALRAIIEMGIVSAGSADEFRRSPNFAIYAEPTSPLIHSKEAIEKLLLCAEYGVPITYSSGVMSGATGPVTLAGSLVVGNAETLSGLVIQQLRRKGAPFIYGIVAAPMDMNTTICLYGGPEVPLFHMAVGAMGRYYKLPTYGISGYTDACVLDLQAAIEATFSIVAAAWSGTHLVHDNGYTGNGLIGNLEHLAMTDEIIEMTKHLMRGVAVNEETIPIDLIHEVGHGGHFLLTDHTMKHFKKETWYPRYMNRKHFLTWQKDDGKDMRQKLKDRILEIIAQDNRNGVSDKELSDMDLIILENEKRIEKSRSYK